MATYTFTLSEQQDITNAFNVGPQNIGDTGNHVPFYTTMSTILSTDTGSGAPDSNAEVLPVRIWFDGATKVNAGQGVFSTLIREYTQTQGELHWDRRFTDFQSLTTISEIQEASNHVARRAKDDLVDTNSWTLQKIIDIANNDADGVGQILFDFVASDTINSRVFNNLTGENAAWSGALLFSSFDDPSNPNVTVDETGRLISTGSSATEADTLDDWRNVLYAQHSYNIALNEATVEGASELFALEELDGLRDSTVTFFEVCMLSGRCDASIITTVKGQVAEDAFVPTVLYGEYRTLNLLNSSSIGEAFTDTNASQVNDNFIKNAQNYFGFPGPQNQSIAATLDTVDNLISQAKQGDNLAQKALFGLSPFKINNGITVNSNFTNKYWNDRGLMTKARLLFDASDTPYNQSVTSFEFSFPVMFKDFQSQSNLVLLEVNNDFLPLSNDVFITFGGENDDFLIGGSENDSLYGNLGDDIFNGGAGNDYLEGGNGMDSYIVNGGRDIIFDSDGNGTVEFNGELLTGGDRLSGQVWISTDQRFKFQQISVATGDQLIISDANNPDDLVTIDQYSDGELGIVLNNFMDITSNIDNFAPSDVTTNGVRDYYSSGSPDNDSFDAGNSYDLVSSGGGDDLILLGNGTDRALSAFGNDTIFGEADSDYIVAGIGFDNINNGPVDKDTVYGGGDVDLISTGVGDDVIHAGDAGDDISAGGSIDQGDWLVADEGNDVVYGSINQDFINAGSGADIVYGGGGFDIILGDGHYDFFVPTNVISSVPAGLAKEHAWNGTDWDTTTVTFALLTPGDAFDFTLGIQANGDFDFTAVRPISVTERIQVSPSTFNNDTIYAGADSDWVSGGMGNDFIYGESGDDMIYGDDIASQPLANPSDYGNDFINGGSGDDLLYGNAGDDVIVGGTGNDMIFGDDQGLTPGDDQLFGDDGVDELYGYGGNDHLSGGAGDDVVLFGGDGDDSVDGNAGNDTLNGDAGNDILHGGDGNDLLNGGDDNDFLFGDNGDDVLNGGAGNDVFSGGLGVDQLNGDAGDDVYSATLNQSDINNPDVITDASGTDRIKFDEFVYPNRINFTDVGGNLLVQYSPNDAFLVTGGAGGNVIEEYEFIDGRILSYADLTTIVKSVVLTKSGNVIMASTNEITAFNDWYEGDDLIQNLDMLAGDDAVIARGGDDVIVGNAGKDVLDGGAGNDTLDGGSENDRLFGATGDDTLIGGLGDDMLAGGDGVDNLTGGMGIDVLRGGRGDDLLQGNDGNDFLQGDRGADTLTGGLGHDTYLFRYQDDPAPGEMPFTTIVDTSDAGGNTIKFLGGLNADDVTLINSLATGDLEVVYGHNENTILSSIHIANSAQGEVISEFQFSDGTSMSFIELCTTQPLTCEKLEELIFKSGFEQAVMKNSMTSSSQKETMPENHIGTSDTVGISSLPILTALLYQVLIK